MVTKVFCPVHAGICPNYPLAPKPLFFQGQDMYLITHTNLLLQDIFEQLKSPGSCS